MRQVLAAWDKHLTHPSLPQTFAAQLRNAGFQDVRMDAHAFATTELIPDAYGGSLVPLLEQYVAEQGGMSQQEAKAWADEQRELGDHGEFLKVIQVNCSLCEVYIRLRSVGMKSGLPHERIGLPSTIH
jgi:hypothetical protein